MHSLASGFVLIGMGSFWTARKLKLAEKNEQIFEVAQCVSGAYGSSLFVAAQCASSDTPSASILTSAMCLFGARMCFLNRLRSKQQPKSLIECAMAGVLHALILIVSAATVATTISGKSMYNASVTDLSWWNLPVSLFCAIEAVLSL